MLGTVLKELRTSHGLNQVEFAKHISVTKQAISNWENNNIMPSVDMLIQIADFYNVSIDFLLERKEEKTLNVSDLTNEQIAHINWIIKDIKDRK